jgi:thioredoxin reductase (NADPH)
MLQALRGLQSRLDFDLLIQDIDRDPQLARRYDEWVPVLLGGGQEICHYRLDQVALEAFLGAGGGGAPRQ